MTARPCPTYYWQPTPVAGTGVTVRCALGAECHGDHMAVVNGHPVYWTTERAELQRLPGATL